MKIICFSDLNKIFNLKILINFCFNKDFRKKFSIRFSTLIQLNFY